MAIKHTPAALPTITSIQIVDLSKLNPNHVDEYMQGVVDAPFKQLDGDEAQRIAELWRNLSAGEQSRCHIPPFGLRFIQGGVVICQASVCWRCDSIYGASEGKRFGFAFDASAAESQELLRLCQVAFGQDSGYT
jgi:hypothetical protein